VSRGLLGTSVLIAQEGQRLDISALPDEVAVSVVTYGELRAGVLAATDVSVRSRRLSTLQTVAELGPLPVDTAVADECARLRLLLATAGRRVNVIDTRIATTALAHDVPVVTQDADYEALAGISDLRVIPVRPRAPALRRAVGPGPDDGAPAAP
jgi:predicted nucleic acid-binding protein